MRIGVVNGPNINLLGQREKNIYGNFSLEELKEFLRLEIGNSAKLDFFQSNAESEIVDYIQNAHKNKLDGIIINAAAYTHTSIAIRDAFLACPTPFIEVHISNIYKRENFRHISYLGDVAQGTIIGLGKEGYLLAVQYFLRTHIHVMR